MKTKLLLLSTLITGTISASAQKADTARAIVHYKFTHIRDTTDKQKPYTENMVLLAGTTASVYKSYDRTMQAAAMKKQMMEQMNNGTGQIKIQSRGGGSSTEYYQFPNENKFVRKERLINPYLIDEPFPQINWKISADTATIGNMLCQKATTHFKGRNYIAWFCPELPFHSGPWKLNGLPGLIVEAHDVKNEVIFKFDGIEEAKKTEAKQDNVAQTAPGHGLIILGMDDASTDPNLISLPTNAIKTTEKEFTNLRDAMRKDPDAFMQSAMAGSGMGGNMKMNRDPNMQMKIQVAPPPVINNPLELPEAK